MNLKEEDKITNQPHAQKVPQRKLSTDDFAPGDLLSGGHIIVTGASGSIGAEVVKSLLRKNYSIIMTCRNLEKCETVKKNILLELKGKEEFISIEELDLGSFASIRKFVETISQKNIRIRGLMNNAATLNRQFSLTPEGFENTVGVNYIGIYLLTKLLLPILEENSVIVNVTSMSTNPKRVDKHFFEFTPDKFTQLGSYSQSKTALMLFTASLSERTQGKFFVNAADPGIVDSNMITLHRWFDPLADLFFRPLIKSPKKGTISLINALCSNQSGKLFLGTRNKLIPDKLSQHPFKDWLWDETERIISEKE